MCERAAELLDVKEDVLQEFQEYDPFGDTNLTGVLCRQSDYRYGAVILFKINEEVCEQIIYCTPKLEYPFDRQGTFHWPNISQLEVWDKLDGTNILAYWYTYKNKKRLTYKTRLTPVLKDGKYGGFRSMWIEYCSENSWINQVIVDNPTYNLSFEMYGTRNPITVTYDTPLDVSLLFGIRQNDHVVKPPSQLQTRPNTKLPERIQIDSKRELTDLYEQLRADMSTYNKEDVFFTEGMVLYAFCNQPSWRQFKCKPDAIQQIHWSHSGIPYRELFNTVINSFEEGMSSYEHFLELLKEEYTDQQIGLSEQRIKKIFILAKEQVRFNAKANKIWKKAKEQGFDVTKDKAQTFRFMSQFFEKKDMQKVGTAILKQAGLTKERRIGNE